MAFVIFESFAGIWVVHGEQMVEELSNWKVGAMFALWGGPCGVQTGHFLLSQSMGGGVEITAKSCSINSDCLLESSPTFYCFSKWNIF